jgi:hypothetical protein
MTRAGLGRLDMPGPYVLYHPPSIPASGQTVPMPNWRPLNEYFPVGCPQYDLLQRESLFWLPHSALLAFATQQNVRGLPRAVEGRR